MADIELVIKIHEDIMEYIKNNGCLSVIYNNEIANAVTNGTPLPKGHGRLIDADAFIDTLGISDRDIYAKECIEEYILTQS